MIPKFFIARPVFSIVLSPGFVLAAGVAVGGRRSVGRTRRGA